MLRIFVRESFELSEVRMFMLAAVRFVVLFANCADCADYVHVQDEIRPAGGAMAPVSPARELGRRSRPEQHLDKCDSRGHERTHGRPGGYGSGVDGADGRGQRR